MVVVVQPRTWPANVIRVTCKVCSRHLDNIVPKDDEPIRAVLFRMCKCGEYNVVDLEFYLTEGNTRLC